MANVHQAKCNRFWIWVPQCSQGGRKSFYVDDWRDLIPLKEPLPYSESYKNCWERVDSYCANGIRVNPPSWNLLLLSWGTFNPHYLQSWPIHQYSGNKVELSIWPVLTHSLWTTTSWNWPGDLQRCQDFWCLRLVLPHNHKGQDPSLNALVRGSGLGWCHTRKHNGRVVAVEKTTSPALKSSHTEVLLP